MISKIFRNTPGKRPDLPAAAFPRISAEDEVKLIKQFLERKFKRKFQTRVKIEGYLGGEVDFKLVVDDYKSSDSKRGYHSIWGGAVQDVLRVHEAFVDSYWRGVKRGFDHLADEGNDGDVLDKWDRERAAELRDTAVASSREEMLLRATAEGLI